MRSFQYLPYLGSLGWEVKVAPLFSDAYVEALYSAGGRFRSTLVGYVRRMGVLTQAAQFDLIWIEKELFPFLPALAEQLLRRLRVPYLVDYDDALFHRYDSHRSRLVRSLLGRKIDVVMRNAAMVVAGNRYLAERAIAAGARRVEVVPTVVDASRYKVVKRLAGERLTVGWVGSPVTARFLSLIAEPLARIQQKHDVRVRFIGSGPIQLRGVRSDVVEWEESSEPELLASLDIGVMPLPDEPWERGKCGYKLIQYMACGLPVVASPVGVNAEIVRQGQNGFLANTADEWAAVLDKLIRAPALRHSMGEAGRARVETEYCLQVQAPRLERLLRSVEA